MRVLIVCWRNGENNPFEYFSNCLAKMLVTLGHQSKIVFLDENFDLAFVELLGWKPNIAIAWQGIGSNIRANNGEMTIWEHYAIPLLCWHGDHPSHMPSNHLCSSKFVYHAYMAASFCTFATSHFSGPGNAPVFLPFVNFFEKDAIDKEGDYFVFPKNIDDPVIVESQWRSQFNEKFSNYLLSVSDLIMENHFRGELVGHHEIVDATMSDAVLQLALEQLNCASLSSAYFRIHSMLDMRYRSIVSVELVAQLNSVPMRIYGRGWERVRALNNSKHSFFEAASARDSGAMFHSRYGILDVMPVYDGLHDRVLRACGAGGAFISVGSWNLLGYLPSRHSSLFASIAGSKLLEQIENVIRDPDGHRDRTCDFQKDYELSVSRLSFNHALQTLTLIRW